MRKKLVSLAIVTLATGLAIGAITATAQEPDPATDPAVVPLPAFDDAAADPAKAVVLGVDFASRTSASVSDAAVSIQRAHTHIGDPPILRLTLRDADGSVIQQMNSWSPLWNFYTDAGKEHMSILPSGSASFIVPFDPELATVTIRDIGLAQDVLTADVSEPIRDFCIANPSDPDCLEADLGVDAVTPVVPPVPVVGTPSPMTVTSVVSNAGPDGPIDAVVTRSATAGSGLMITPSLPQSEDVDGLAVGTTREVDATYSLLCTEPGTHTVDFTTSIAPKIGAVVDPNPTNDTRTVTATVECATPVAFNIRPGSAVNEINLGSGVVLTVVVTNDAGEYGLPLAFDATTIDATSVRFGTRSLIASGGGTPERENRGHRIRSFGLDEELPDGDIDMGLHFDPRLAGLTIDDTEACVRGRYTAPDGNNYGFIGCDLVTIVPNSHSL